MLAADGAAAPTSAARRCVRSLVRTRARGFATFHLPQLANPGKSWSSTVAALLGRARQSPCISASYLAIWRGPFGKEEGASAASAASGASSGWGT